MTVRQLGQDDGEELSPGELARSLARIEATLSGLENRLVVRAVYEAEQREAHNVATQITLRAAEDRDHVKAALAQERSDRVAWQSGAISWIRWIVATLGALGLTLAGLIISILNNGGKT